MNFIHTKTGVLKKIIFSIFIFATVITLASPNLFIVSAQSAPAGQYTLLEPLPCIPSKDANGKDVCTAGTQMQTVDFKTYVQYAFNLIIALAAVAAVFMIVMGGFKYTSTDSFTGKNEGRKMIEEAIKGLLLVLCAYLLLKTIDPRLVEIPVTLVEPLNIKCRDNPNISAMDSRCKGSTGNFFDELTDQARRYKISYDQLAAQTRATRATLAEKEVLLAEINTKLSDIYEGADATQEEENQLSLDRQRILNDINETEAKISVEATSLFMTSTLQTTNRDLDSEGYFDYTRRSVIMQQAKDLTQQAWESGSNDLQRRGVDSGQQEILDDTYFMTYGNLVLREQIERRAPVDAVPVVKREVGEYIDSIVDPVKKQQLQESYDTSMRLLCKGSYGTTNKEVNAICSVY